MMTVMMVMIMMIMIIVHVIIEWVIFAFSDEDKMNGMFAETSRNREMCNQIIRRVFTDFSQSNHSLPDGPLVSSEC